ncbi:MAG: DsbA family protein, partial [Phycisphaerae bacterium]
TLALWPRFRRTVILGERVGDASAQSIAVYVPPPDYPPARAAFAWVLIAAGLCTGAYGIYRYQSARQETRAVMAVAKALEARLKDYDDDYQAVFNNFMNEPVMVIPIEANDSIRGRHDAPHTIVMFTDLQCPHCLNAEKIISEKLAKYPDRLRLVFKHYPLNRDCNPNVQGKTHVAACAAAIAVEGARNLAGDEVFWKMYDELFHHQGEFARGALNFVKEACGRIGIENDALWKKIHTLGIDQRIREHTEQARVLGIQSTPAIYFDGRKVAGWVNSKFWDFLMYLDKSGNLPVIPPSMAPPPSTTPAPATTPAGL